MSTWDTQNFYFSGQGVVLIGKRTSTGKPAGLLAVGNCPELKISIATTVVEHHESQTGQRAIDLRLVTLTKGQLSVTLENFIAENLATALRGVNTVEAGSTVTGEEVGFWPGLVAPLARVRVSEVDLSGLTLFDPSNPTTPWDYKLNTEAGSVQWNDGVDVAFDGVLTPAAGVGHAIASVTAGSSTVYHFASGLVPPEVEVGNPIYVAGFDGADKTTFNVTQTITAFDTDADTVTTSLASTGKVAGVGGIALTAGFPVLADYTFDDQNLVDALTLGQQTRYLRFEGLNTADGFAPMVVEVFRFVLDPTKDLGLISDTVDQFVLEGSVLADQLQTTGSKFFKTSLLRNSKSTA